MLIAAEEIKKLNGGTLIVKDGEVLASIQLEIGGLITGRKSADVVKDLKIFIAPLRILRQTLTLIHF